MKVVAQRVSRASVSVDSKKVAEIGKGLLLLVGFRRGESQELSKERLEKIASKIINTRLFNDEDGKINLNLHQVSGDILSVSQFTLYASTKKGNRPSFNEAASSEEARPLYSAFNQILEEKLGKPIFEGIFGEEMAVDLVNDGPLTLIYEDT